MKERIITKENFEAEVLKSDRPVLIDFWASWCGPCRMLAPVIAEIAGEHPEIKVCKVNVDEEPELTSVFRVSSIPMLAVIRNGKVIHAAAGVRPKEQILRMLSER